MFSGSNVLTSALGIQVEQLVALQGVILLIACTALLYAPCISYISEWFVKRRGLANGIVMMGTAAGGLVCPYVLPPLLRAHGTAGTLRILAVAIIVLLLPVLPFVKPRLPESRMHGPGRRSVRREWLTDVSWWILMVTNTIHGFGAFVPILYLPTFASALNLNSSSTSLTIALLNGASAIGPLILGILTDHFSPWPLALFTCILTSLATFVLWGVVGNVTAGLMVFGTAYGLLAGGWTTLWAGFVRDMSKDDPSLPTLLYGFLMLSRGLGNVLSTPISTSLSSATTNVTSTSSSLGHEGRMGFSVADGKFEKLIVYVGSCFAGAAALALVGWGGDKAVRLRRS
ncbi:hypothetical protein EW146_g9045 [Bondarzewia mesenterica]|uniref:Major facilitator superfamily (MFS) profile domain-containing protein n=1 Tax=Bondarzewia mesenterica TaxID=1095465 RepID=A0A4S4L9N7_9AGAM|nr:hypothetical protein EW146_g9045 [Bondarzewia mesenterica]